MRIGIRTDAGGVARLRQNLEKVRLSKLVATYAGLRQCAEAVFQLSQTYVPVDTGLLRLSGEIEEVGVGPESTGGGKFASSSQAYFQIVYTAPYAIYVHEIMGYNHAPPTCAKFLERAARETDCSRIMREAYGG